MDFNDWFDGVLVALWVLGNLVVLSVFLSASLFAILYPIFWDWRHWTTAGTRIWRAILSVAGLGLLIVIGLFLDGSVEWWQMPSNVSGWRVLLRLVVYGLIAYSFADLVKTLVIRKFWPERLKTAPLDENTLGLVKKPGD